MGQLARCRLLICVAMSVLLLSVVAADRVAFAADKPPVPNDVAQKPVLATIKDLFKSDLAAAKSPTQMTELAEKMLAAIESKPESAVNDYVLLTQSLALAEKASHISLSRRIVAQTGELFDVDVDDLTVLSLKNLAKGPANKDYHQELAKLSLQLATAAQRADRPDLATQHLELVDTIGRRLKTNEWSKLTAARRAEIAEQKKLSESHIAAEKTLATNPQDPAANEAAGRYLIVVRQDWDRGIKRLMLSGDATLRTVATDDNTLLDAATTVSPEATFKVADGWWDAAATLPGPAQKSAFKLRAGQWYAEAAPKLKGLTKTKAEQRVQESGWTNDPELVALMPLSRREHLIATAIRTGQGMLTNDFAIVQTLPLAEAKSLDDAFKAKMFRAIRFRPFPTSSGIKVAAIWRRSSSEGDLFDGTIEEVFAHDAELRDKEFYPQDLAGYFDADGKPRHVLLSRKGKQAEGVVVTLTLHHLVGKDRPYNQPPESFMVSRQQYFDRDGNRFNDLLWRQPKSGASSYAAGDRKYYEKLVAENAATTKLLDISVASSGKAVNYSMVCQKLAGFTVSERHGLTLEENLVEWPKLAATGALPVAIGVAVSPDGTHHSASLWHTPDKK